ncbi:alg9-like mannosyltransferase [Grosmannia clavigera kw1407]|uniref:Mannosyltransferase n=1 Tax=Grosmannia clavigera (strain kw1407 / UAMH 11150) TaxID=655863 RepID=F0XGW9_GROCL|nr:alg9-like mannosyltransferase [Grosmannia clavigera kw1407]EFX02587.1 alg9-like mannosyltransferase [Grosmannia clavigera kw1407]
MAEPRQRRTPVDAPSKTPAVSYADAAAAAPVHDEVLAAQTADVLTLLLILRFCSALCVRTFFQPDEYFQALEPAWELAFGPISGAWLTWEWRQHLRTSLHPVLFAVAYAAADSLLRLMHCVGPLRAIILTHLPTVVQAVIAAVADFSVWRLAGHLYGRDSNATWTALWLCVLSPWQWYCGTRTFSNGLEAALTSAALVFWPWQLFAADSTSAESLFDSSTAYNTVGRVGPVGRLRLSLLLAAFAVVLRPTNLLIWAALLTVAVTRLTLDSSSSSSSSSSPLRPSFVARLAVEIAACGSLVLAVSAVSDRLFYGVWTLPAYTFLDVNLAQDVAVFYGRNPWHYYLSQGLPLLTMASLPWALTAVYAALTSSSSPSSSFSSNARRALAFSVVTTVAVLSLVAHKEVRFLYPLLPVLNVLAAPQVASFFTATLPSTSSASKAPPSATSLRHKRLLSVGLVLQAVVAVYLSFFHQPAPLSVLSFLRHEYERIHHNWLELTAAELPYFDVYPDYSFLHQSSIPSILASGGGGDELFALFLLPCHSTPWRSHLVYPGLRARALTCEPPLHTAPRSAERAAYLDEADRFYAALGRHDPAARNAFFVEELWPRFPWSSDAEATEGTTTWMHNGEIPRYIVGFEGIEDVLVGYFASDDPATGGADLGISLRRVWTGWNGFFNEDWRRRGSLIVWDTGVYSNASHPDTL